MAIERSNPTVRSRRLMEDVHARSFSTDSLSGAPFLHRGNCVAPIDCRNDGQLESRDAVEAGSVVLAFNGRSRRRKRELLPDNFASAADGDCPQHEFLRARSRVLLEDQAHCAQPDGFSPRQANRLRSWTRCPPSGASIRQKRPFDGRVGILGCQLDLNILKVEPLRIWMRCGRDQANALVQSTSTYSRSRGPPMNEATAAAATYRSTSIVTYPPGARVVNPQWARRATKRGSFR